MGIFNNSNNLDYNNQFYNYTNLFFKDFIKKIIMEKIDNLHNKNDVDNIYEIPIDISKIHYRKVDDINIVHELNYKYNSIILMFDYNKDINLENIFSLIISIFNKYGIKYDYQNQKKELRYWTEEKGILTLHTSLKNLIIMYENEIQNYINNDEDNINKTY